MTTAVPYEDVQTAATHIAQCAMNALTVSVIPHSRDGRSRSHVILGCEWTFATTSSDSGS